MGQQPSRIALVPGSSSSAAAPGHKRSELWPVKLAEEINVEHSESLSVNGPCQAASSFCGDKGSSNSA